MNQICPTWLPRSQQGRSKEVSLTRFRPDTVVDNEWETPWSVFASQRPEWRPDEVYREELWRFPEGKEHRPLTFFEIYGDTVWGATAAMLRQLLSIGLGLDDGLAYDKDPLGRDDPGDV